MSDPARAAILIVAAVALSGSGCDDSDPLCERMERCCEAAVDEGLLDRENLTTNCDADDDASYLSCRGRLEVVWSQIVGNARRENKEPPFACEDAAESAQLPYWDPDAP